MFLWRGSLSKVYKLVDVNMFLTLKTLLTLLEDPKKSPACQPPTVAIHCCREADPRTSLYKLEPQHADAARNGLMLLAAATHDFVLYERHFEPPTPLYR